MFKELLKLGVAAAAVSTIFANVVSPFGIHWLNFVLGFIAYYAYGLLNSVGGKLKIEEIKTKLDDVVDSLRSSGFKGIGLGILLAIPGGLYYALTFVASTVQLVIPQIVDKTVGLFVYYLAQFGFGVFFGGAFLIITSFALFITFVTKALRALVK